MAVDSFPERVPRARNLAIFWGATLEGRSQAELAAEHGVSQQRISQIVCSVRQFLALATSEQYEGVPQEAQLQLGCRIQLEKLSRRRREVSQAWTASTGPKTSVKRVQGPHGERVETGEKSQHGDWRIDRQLGEIDKQMLDTQRLLYERAWFGKERRMRNAELGMRNEEEGIRNSESGMRNGEEVAMAEQAGVVDLVQDTEYSVLSTKEVVGPAVEMADAVLVEVDSVPESAIRNPQSAIAPPESAIEPPAQPIADPATPVRRMWRSEPICDLSGRRIMPPKAGHRPWRRVRVPREWLLQGGPVTGYTPEGVLWKLASPLLQVGDGDTDHVGGSCEMDSAWDELGAVRQECLESSEMLVGV